MGSEHCWSGTDMDGNTAYPIEYYVQTLLQFLHGDNIRGRTIPPPPASKKAVAALPDQSTNARTPECTVCLAAFSSGELGKRMPCKHVFHSECLLKWLSQTNSCPVCRYELPTDDEQYEILRQEKIREEQSKEALQNLHRSMYS